jgi:hypothetical protein
MSSRFAGPGFSAMISGGTAADTPAGQANSRPQPICREACLNRRFFDASETQSKMAIYLRTEDLLWPMTNPKNRKTPPQNRKTFQFTQSKRKSLETTVKLSLKRAMRKLQKALRSA